MKTRLFIFLLLFGQCQSAFSQQEGPQYTRISIGLKGKVKELVSTTYTLRGEGSQQQAFKLYGSWKIYYPDGFLDSSFSANSYDSLKWHLNYHYYWKGDTLCSTVHPVNAWAKVLFNKEQLVVYSEFYSEKSIRQYSESFCEYDSMGRLVRIFSRKDPQGNVLLYQYKKNTDGSFTQTRKDKPTRDFKIFNEKQQMISHVFFDNIQNVKTEWYYFYNEHGDLKTQKEMMYKKEGEKWVPISKDGTTKTYRYVYDQQNNWISMETTYNGKPFELEKRIISYWE